MTEKKPTVRKRRSSEDLRDEIVRAAAVEYSLYGFDGATTAAIAKRARSTEAQIFRYFSSKAELFRAAVLQPLDEHLQTFTARSAGPPDGPVSLEREAERYVTELLDFLREHERMFFSLITADVRGVAGVADVDALHEYFAHGAAMTRMRQSPSEKISPDLMVRISFAAVLGCVMFREWLFPKELSDDEMVRKAVIRFVLDGIYAPPFAPGEAQ
ncbi:TetR/AcrR family transcriptional regulator [Novosphingobium sp. M1R2S20]|uniref:TetR/AcrR family transcriptional regulator n=1 Tax=Novosphingobium rhizovicinum TaxID=3228928 RepID=A0ABV3REP7_9SPHN